MRAKHPFTLYKRKLKIDTVWYYTAYNDTNKRIRASTGKLNKREAYAYCMELYKQGKLVPHKKTLLHDYASPFFTNECSYIKRREMWRNRNLSEGYRTALLNKLVLMLRYLPKIALASIENAMQELSKNYSSKTVNDALASLSIVFDEAIRENLITTNPCKQVARMHSNKTEKGILSIEEVKRLFTIEWENEQMKLFNLIAALTGMRRGELLALHVADVKESYIHVCHAYGSGEGIKDRTKTGVNRYVPLPKQICETLKQNARKSGLVFEGISHDGTVPENKPAQELYKALEKIGISDGERQERNITFHSWRHFFNTFCRSSGVPDSKVQAVTGHTTKAMTEHYTHFTHSDFAEVSQLQENLLKNNL